MNFGADRLKDADFLLKFFLSLDNRTPSFDLSMTSSLLKAATARWGNPKKFIILMWIEELGPRVTKRKAWKVWHFFNSKRAGFTPPLRLRNSPYHHHHPFPHLVDKLVFSVCVGINKVLVLSSILISCLAAVSKMTYQLSRCSCKRVRVC